MNFKPCDTLDYSTLDRTSALNTLAFMQHCLVSHTTGELNQTILAFAHQLGFEFVLYGYTQTLYTMPEEPEVINLSNPAAWSREYERDHLLYDPVLHEVALRINAGEYTGFFIWDEYSWDLTIKQQRVIDRRRHFGLEYGCSLYCDSRPKDFAFLLSLASATTRPDASTETIAHLIVPQLMATTKRLDLQAMIGSLTRREKMVAQAMMDGKTNSAIARDQGITENTVKFHLKNIFRKLQVTNRKQAIGVLTAERYLGI